MRTHIGDETNFYQPGEKFFGNSYCPIYRTYTGHEDLWMFGLINANARLYSPYLGRFVSPDPLLNSEGGPLDYNPYIYARNNPYKYIDRNGEFPWLLFGAALGAGFNIWQNSDNIHCFGDALFYGFAGAGAGSLGGWIGPSATVSLGLAATGGIPGVVSGAITGFISSTIEGTLNAAYSGDFSKFSLGSIFTQTAFSAFLGGVRGGMDAVRKNTNFFTGIANFDATGAYSTSNTGVVERLKGIVRAKYVHEFEGVNVYETKELGDASSGGPYSACTIPERGIITGIGVYYNDIPMMQHEFGHILQYYKYGPIAYWKIIAPESVASASLNSCEAHRCFWTETHANYLSREYFGQKWQGMSNPRDQYPPKNISLYNATRLRLAHVKFIMGM